MNTDRDLLKEAWGLLPRLPIDDLDILVVDIEDIFDTFAFGSRAARSD